MIKEKDSYNGITMKQMKGIQEHFINFFNNNKIDIVIEIGSLPGAFAMFLSDTKKLFNWDFYTFDIRTLQKNIKKYIENNGGFCYTVNALETNIISDLIKSNKRVLILNDGIKVPFFIQYAPLLKMNDMIFSHDYNDEWVYSDIEKTMKEYNIKEITELEYFKEYLWFPCIKK